MNRLRRILFLAGLGGTMASAAAEADSRPTPQPRVRLHPSAQGYVARPEATPRATATPLPTTMEKVVVAESKLPVPPRSDEQPEPERFSPSRGGPIFSGKIGSLPLEVGLWPWRDVFADDAQFKPQRTRVYIEVVRLKL